MQQNEKFTSSVTMKDGTTHDIQVTRTDIELYLADHNKAKLICPDDDELFARYLHVYTYDYNKSHPKPKSSKRGGFREGAGRKPKAGGSFHHGFRFSKRVHDILEEHRYDMTDFVERAIIFYYKRECLK